MKNDLHKIKDIRVEILELVNTNLELVEEDLRVEYSDNLLNYALDTFLKATAYSKIKNICFDNALETIIRSNKKSREIELARFYKFSCHEDASNDMGLDDDIKKLIDKEDKISYSEEQEKIKEDEDDKRYGQI